MMKNNSSFSPNSTDPAPKDKIKVRLDARTVVLLNSMQTFRTWKSRFPDAHIIK